MAYHVELRGIALSSKASRTAPYVLQSSVTTEAAVGERPVASLSVRVPPGATFAPEDFDELTIDYPVLPYRSWAERHADLVAYWRLDEAPVISANDSNGNATPLTFGGGNGLQYRALRSESAAVPYGAAPEWGHTSGAGLSGTLPAAIGAQWTIAGFLRLKTSAPPIRAPRARLSFFDSSVVGDYDDPEVTNSTPGCVLTFTPGQDSNAPILGVSANRRPPRRIPPSWVTGAVDAFWATVQMQAANIVVRTSTDQMSAGSESGPDLTPAAESTIGVALRAVTGETISFLISDLDDSTEPYQRSLDNTIGTDPAWDTAPISTFSGAEFSACRTAFLNSGGTVVIVDSAHANVDWDTLEFIGGDPVPLALPATVDQSATVGTAFSLTLPEATGGTTPRTYTATNLPAGLSFNANTRVLSGTPTTAQTRTVTYQVTDDAGDAESDTFAIVVSAASQALALPATADQVANVGVFFTITLPMATGGSTPYAYSTSFRPSGLTFDSTTRVLSGTPTTIQSRNVRYRVTDGDGTVEDDRFVIDVQAAPTSTGDVVLEAGTLTVLADRDIGQVSVEIGTETLIASSPVDDWAHVAVRRTSSAIELWVDGVRRDTGTPPSGAVLDSAAFEMAVAGGTAIDLALDEWGIWSSAIDVAALYARRDAYRQFGGYVFGIVDRTDIGPDDRHVLDLSVTGYGFRLDANYVREVYASSTGDTVREIVQDVLELAGLAADFSSHGVELNDIVTRAVYPVESVMNILRSLATDHGAIVVVDEWREIDMVRRNNVENSDLVLVGGRAGNVASIGSKTEPRFYANRSIVVGRGEVGTYELSFTTDGATRRYDSPQPIGEVLSITVDGLDETFEGAGARWEVDSDQQRFELAAGETPSAAGKDLKIAFVALPALTVTVDNSSAVTDVGFSIARRFEDDAIDTVGVARVVAQARLDRGDQRFQDFTCGTQWGKVRRVRPGVAPMFTFPRHGLNATRLLVERCKSHLGPPGTGPGDEDHPVVWSLEATALDYPGSEGDDFRHVTENYRPQAPRPGGSGTAADPNVQIIDPTNVAVPARLPLSLSEGLISVAVGRATWAVPIGANLVRVSGHEIAHPLVMQLMGNLRPRGSLVSGQLVEVRLWDATTSQAIGSAVSVTSATIDRYVLRAVILPLRDFDLTFQLREVGSIRGQLWGVTMDLDI